jgi:ribosome-binding protein aMBF1 (putative translation factor)
MRADRHTQAVAERARRSPRYRSAFRRTLHQIDLALLVREMREKAGLTQAELATRIRTTQSVIARLEAAEYAGHSLEMLERIAGACRVSLTLRAKGNPRFNREVALV